MTVQRLGRERRLSWKVMRNPQIDRFKRTSLEISFVCASQTQRSQDLGTVCGFFLSLSGDTIIACQMRARATKDLYGPFLALLEIVL